VTGNKEKGVKAQEGSSGKQNNVGDRKKERNGEVFTSNKKSIKIDNRSARGPEGQTNRKKKKNAKTGRMKYANKRKLNGRSQYRTVVAKRPRSKPKTPRQQWVLVCGGEKAGTKQKNHEQNSGVIHLKV